MRPLEAGGADCTLCRTLRQGDAERRTQMRLNEAAGTADAMRGIVWQANCHVTNHPLKTESRDYVMLRLDTQLAITLHPWASFKRPNRKCPASAVTDNSRPLSAWHFCLGHSVMGNKSLILCHVRSLNESFE